MINSSHMRRSEVGEVRPSQILTTFGVGSLVDLPNISVIVMGIDDWKTGHSTEIGEERLLRSAQSLLGPQVKRLVAPPRAEEASGTKTGWFDESRLVGVPVAPFPRWMVCTRCRLLAPLGSGLFEAKVQPYRPDRARYIHNCTTQGRPPLVVPARFLVTCDNGHLDDFPWLDFVHRGKDTTCTGPLRMWEFGPSGEISDVTIKCDGCGMSRKMVEAIGPAGQQGMPPCNGRRPHLRDHDPEPCSCEHVRPIALGASNLWFPVVVSVLHVPQARDDLGRLIEDNWTVLEKASTPEVLKAFRDIGQLKDFGKYSDGEILAGIARKHDQSSDTEEDPDDLKTPEWRVFSRPENSEEGPSFKVRAVDPPDEYESIFDKIVLVEKLREVRALAGFTRLVSPRDFDSPAELPPHRRAPISRRAPEWLPASETRGEGIFFQFREERIKEWVAGHASYEAAFLDAHTEWRRARGFPNPDQGFPGIRFVLLHSFAHAMLRQLSIECGYTTASIAERLYSRGPGGDAPPMAGVLIYTAAPDSEGTLGGLCALGSPSKLGRHIRGALDKLRLCSSDPLCAEHKVGRGTTLHGVACHACAFLPETSCERGNKYLDRASLVPTMLQSDLAFFE